MNLRNSLYLVLILAFLTGPISGCSTGKGLGKLGYAQDTVPRITLNQLVEDWKDYDIYYSGMSESEIYGVMFDPKKDERKLVGHEWWVPVETQEDLTQKVKFINAFDAQPQLWTILSPDDQLHGFIYTLRHPVLVEVVDDQTLWVDELTFPPLCIICGPNEPGG